MTRGGGAVGFSPSPSARSDSSKECSDSTINSTASPVAPASPVALAKEIKKMIKEMNRKADKRDQKIKKSHQMIIGMLGQIKEEFKYLEVLVKDRAASGEHVGGGYVEKYKALVVSIPLLTQDFTKHAWNKFEKLSDIPPQPKYYEAFGNSLFKLLMFFQDNGHFFVPSKEQKLYNWVKNQRNFMRQYEYSLTHNYQGEFPKNPTIINSAYYYLLKDELGLPSSKFDRDDNHGRDV
jgi:hypothetical protein